MSSPDSASQETSLYDNLPMHGRQVRLIEITSTKPEIVCKLEVVSLDDKPAYSALSYVWGDPEITRSVLVNGKRVNVAINLVSALEHAPKHLADAKAAPRLWADALSINQNDPNEKNHQVPFMKDIYSQAEIVICWLGASDDKTYRAMDWIDVMARECSFTDEDKNLAWLINHPSFYEVSHDGQGGVLDLQRAFILPYWTRVWIFQEVALAKIPIFACGTRSVSLASLDQLTCWARLMMDNTTLARPQIINSSSWEVIKYAFRLIYEALIPMFEARRTEHHHLSTCLKVRNEPVSSESHWRMACSLSASNPKDYFYGFLSLSCLNLVPDYTPNTSVGMVCRDFLVEYVRASREGLFGTSGELELLVFAGVGHGWQKYPDTPSWAPNLPGLNEKKGTGWPVFSHSSLYFEDLVISSSEKAKFSGTDMLNIAMILDTVQELGPLRHDFIDVETWRGPRGICSWIVEFAMGREQYVTGCHPLAALHSLLHFEAVIQEDGPASQTPDLEKAMGFAQLVTLHYRDEEYDGDEKADPEKPSPRIEYLYRLIGGLPIDHTAVDEACSRLLEGSFGKGQRLAETGLGYVGMFPLHVQPGDVVCVLNALRCPAVLRKVDEHYAFVGTCFLQGLETMEQVRQLGRKQEKGVETVVIR